MKVVLFCGGLGTRLREYSQTIPKPLVTIGYRPIIWHVMRYYAHYGHTDFILCLGYRGDMIKEFFLNYNECMSNDFVMSKGGKEIELNSRDIDDWRISFVDTGINSNIGQRLKAVREYVADENWFLANYSDGLTDLPLDTYLAECRKHDKIANFVAVQPSYSLHAVRMNDEGIVDKIGHTENSDLLVNGGFFLFKNEIFDYIRDGEELVEAPFRRLISERQLFGFRYTGFWRPMDTFKDKSTFDQLYEAGDARWEVWKR